MTNETETPARLDENTTKDSFDFPLSKNPWLLYALAHIPIVVIMVVVLYFLYQSKSGG